MGSRRGDDVINSRLDIQIREIVNLLLAPIEVGPNIIP